MTRTDINQYVDLIDDVSDLLKKQLKINNDFRRKFLTQCQEIIIMFGEKLEAVTNPKDKRYINQNRLIKKLEDLCERIYTFSYHVDATYLDDILKNINDVRQLIVSMPVTYRVVFLPYKASMWDSLESIWREFSKDEDFEASVVPIPYYEEDRISMQYVPRYEGNIFPEDVPIVSFREYRLEEKKPDLVFIHNPYDNSNYVTMVHPDYFSWDIKKNCGLLVYVSYFVNEGIVRDTQKIALNNCKADYIVLQSEQQKECCRGLTFYDRILPLGSPKFDKIFNYCKNGVSIPEEWQYDFSCKKKLLLNTTIVDLLENNETIFGKLKAFFRTVLERKDVAVIWRPHPLLEATVKAMHPELIKQYQDLVKFFNDNKIGVFDTTADVSRAVVVSDAYIGSDNSSIIALFEFCNKPVFILDSTRIFTNNVQRKKKKADEVFSMSGKIRFFDATESEDYMFEDFVYDLTYGNLTNILKRERIEEAGLAANPDGTCGRKTYEFFKNRLFENTEF